MDSEKFERGRTAVATSFGEISVVSVGAGSPAVFVHGVGTNAHLWRRAIGVLGGRRRCLAIDLPLHGHSSAGGSGDLGLGGLAAAVIEACDALELDQFDLVAHDTGGAVAQVVAARVPDRVRSLTLTNCEVHDNVPPAGFAPTVELARSGELATSGPLLLADLAAARAAVFSMGYERPEQLSLDEVRGFLEPVLGTPERAASFARLLVSLTPDDLLAAEHELARLAAPTLIVWGTGDEMFEVSWAHYLADLIPHATVVELDGAKLFFPDERGVELAAIIAEHWDRSARRLDRSGR